MSSGFSLIQDAKHIPIFSATVPIYLDEIGNIIRAGDGRVGKVSILTQGM